MSFLRIVCPVQYQRGARRDAGADQGPLLLRRRPSSGLHAALLAAAAALTLDAATATKAAAQTDYRNLDLRHPLGVEDAFPIERYAFEVAGGYAFSREPGNGRTHEFGVDIMYGIANNVHVGLEAPMANILAGDATRTGLVGLTLSTLWNANVERPGLPALSLRGDVVLPVGLLSGRDVGFGATLIATESFGRTRAHLNVAGSAGGRGLDALPRWRGTFALDRALLRQSTLLVAEVTALKQEDGDPTTVLVAAGLRRQWTPTLVLDLGASRRLSRATGPNIALSLGLSYTFGFAGLMPAGNR